MRPQYKTLLRLCDDAVTYKDAADQLRVDSSDDMAYIKSLIEVATEYVEDTTGVIGSKAEIKVIASRWQDLTCSPSSCLVQLQRSPITAVWSISTYINGTLTTLSTDEYLVHLDHDLVTLEPAASWPDHDTRSDAIQIVITAGHDQGNKPPARWRHAVKMMVAHLYENRTTAVIGSAVNALPHGMSSLIEQIRIGGRVA